MFCCKSKKATRNKSQIGVMPVNYAHNRSQSVSLVDSPDSVKKNPMFSKQSPHFSQIEITKTKILKPNIFDEKTKLHCQFCGGKTCKHENWTRCPTPAIQGLHSNWINDNVIASQRLSDRLIHQFEIIKQFKEKGVTAVFNLQEPGEHPYCGDGINVKSGFSYHPELLMNSGIAFFNFFWKDLTNPTFERLLNSAQVMDYIIKGGGKCLVHCHAGQGRTALIIGAYLIISGTASDDKEAIKQTKKNRPKCFSKSYNIKYMKTFYDKFVDLKVLFPSQQQKQSLKEILVKQGLLFHGDERKYTKFIPKVVNQALQSIKDILKNSTVRKPDEQLNEYKQLMDKNNEFLNAQIQSIRQLVNKGDWNVISDHDDIQTLNYVVVCFIQGLNKHIVDQNVVDKMKGDLNKLDNYLLGFMTAIADLCQVLSQDISDLKQQQEIFKFYAELISQEQTQFYEPIQQALIEISKKKNQIYRLEEIKEAEDISPIKQQLLKDQITTGQTFYNNPPSGRSIDTNQQRNGPREEINSVNLAQSEKEDFTLEQRDAMREDPSIDTLQLSQKITPFHEDQIYRSQDGPLPGSTGQSSVKQLRQSQLLPDIHQKQQ
ncbi:protein tyrosine phosphatase domain-containing protein 1 [Stylonychia lemnae]|uniref:Protein tyrosine phosphatase domain-containing protein 1 n=1 Tax=Stylonychia lemnae TaxID=5949 RepID=A0A078AY45_STYLE|nr:protein tyrosine phosphatase domain-containing protein 1 [Stylonychia lemnae]|eukprot:CDW87041.1 protein tyrosine phosphatase domain-containing protein 1 [Stylonychia lemnae]